MISKKVVILFLWVLGLVTLGSLASTPRRAVSPPGLRAGAELLLAPFPCAPRADRLEIEQPDTWQRQTSDKADRLVGVSRRDEYSVPDTGLRQTNLWMATPPLPSWGLELGYDGLGARTVRTDELVTHRFVVDRVGRLQVPLVETDDSNTAIRYYIWAPNLEGQAMAVSCWLENLPSSVRRFDGTTITNIFDGETLLTETRNPDSTNRYTYYRNRILRTAANELCAITNAIDATDQTTQTSMGCGNLAPWTVQYGYYPAGQISNVVTAAGSARFQFDAGERLTNLSANGMSWGIAYGASNGLASSMTCTNTGIETRYEYDNMDRVTNLSWLASGGGVLRSFGYRYNAAGMITNMALSDGSAFAYSYDSLDQLTGETRSVSGAVVQSIAYVYDEAGNRITKNRDGITVSYTHSNGCNRLSGWTATSTNDFLALRSLDIRGESSEAIGTNAAYGQLWVSNLVAATPSVAGASFALDNMAVSLGTQTFVAAIGDVAGNVTTASTNIVVAVTTNAAYSYNAAGCVTNIHTAGPGFVWDLNCGWDSQYRLVSTATNGTVIERYGYGPGGERVWTWTPENGTNWHMYMGAQVVADLDATGAAVRTYVFGPGIDNVLAMTTYGGVTNTYYFLKDHLGTVHALVNSAGQVVESYCYDTWGRILGVYDQNNMPLRESAIGNRILWQGREYSFKTGLYYFRARWADPITGRWLSPDPVGIAGGMNQYVMMANNVINFIDPFGWCGTPYEPGIKDDTFGFITALTPIKLPLVGAIAGKLADIAPGLFGRFAANNGQGFTSMYRAVSKTELDDIAARGFQLKSGGYESKLFATSAEDAAAFGRDLYKLDQVPFHVVETKVPNSVFSQFERMPLDFKPAVNVPGSMLPQLNNSMRWSELISIPVGR